MTAPRAVPSPYGLFDVFGIELEYMIVDADTLDVRPMCDALFREATGASVSDVYPDGAEGVVSWSNELALHVVELKAAKPVACLDSLLVPFQSHVGKINTLLAPMNCRLLPTGMHPWMNPDKETQLWPHEYNEIYQTYDRIFGCNGHGWGNLQSTHINLPFANDDEFGRLHAAIRLVLPLLPALAASSPLADGQMMSLADYRLAVYQTNSDRVPMMTGQVIPEPVFTPADYQRDILEKLYDDLAPLDPEGHLREEFANARGAIARFDRGAIEIRVLDIQECPEADLAIAALVVGVLRALVAERWGSYTSQQLLATDALYPVFTDTVRHAEQAVIREPKLLAAFGLPVTPITAGELWMALLEQVMPLDGTWTPLLRRLVPAGSLSTRIRTSLPSTPGRAAQRAVYTELADCLQSGDLFRVG
ncbi:MAG: glutamate-cysteine ligase family protein [Burkholderiaceae bacterium]